MPRYPYALSLDDRIDVGAIPALDAAMIDALTEHHADPSRREPLTVEHRPTRVYRIHLSRRRPRPSPGPVGPTVFHDFGNPELYEPRVENRRRFWALMAFIATLPFVATARIMIAYSFDGQGTPLHGDHPHEDLLQEFIWLQTNFSKRFYMCNPHGAVTDRRYVESHLSWFDTCEHYQRHASDDVGELCFSVRIDGVFEPKLRERVHESTRRARASRGQAPRR